jgi:transposase
MNRLDASRRAQIISSLLEGNSLRSTSRMADVSINTVIKLALGGRRSLFRLSGSRYAESEVQTPAS